MGLEVIHEYCNIDTTQSFYNVPLVCIILKHLMFWNNRYSGGVDWRQKLDVQPGAVLANELKHNACKLAKWTVQALLVGSDIIKFG